MKNQNLDFEVRSKFTQDGKLRKFFSNGVASD
jgi:hypothetical protein